MKERSKQQRHQSGQPGAGKGRKEVVRGSGIYPASGPLPPGPAPVKAPAALGRRASATARRRGGRATIVGRTRAGGRTTAALARTLPRRASAGPTPAAQTRPYPHEVPRAEWEAFLNGFSKQHGGWESEIRVFQPDQTSRMATQGLPFQEISIDYKGNESTTVVSAGEQAADHIRRMVPRTSRIIALNPDELEIDATDRSRTLVRCRRPRR